MTTKRTAQSAPKKMDDERPRIRVKEKAAATGAAAREIINKVVVRAKRAAEPTPACMECGSVMARTRGPHRYTVEGGWSVLLENAEKLTCLGCREESVVIDAPAKLQRAIAAAVVAKEGRLAPEEMVFLRRYIGLPATKLARAIGVTAGTVSRWENGHEPIGTTPDHLLRALVMLYNHSDVDFNQFENLGVGNDSRPARTSLRFGDDGDWHLPSSA